MPRSARRAAVAVLAASALASSMTLTVDVASAAQPDRGSTASSHTGPPAWAKAKGKGQQGPPPHAAVHERRTPAAPAPEPETPQPEESPGSEMTLVWKDDFSGPAGAGVDDRYWTEQTGGAGWGNDELQRYQDGARNAFLDGEGHLVIEARPAEPGEAGTCWYGECRYTSARLTTATKVSVSSGRVEARLKLPGGQGVWPAFWMLGDNIHTHGHPYSGEIDIMELVGHEPHQVWSSVHGPGYTLAGLSKPFTLPNGASFSDAFHTFAVEWTETGLAFSVDGEVYHRVDRSDIGDHEWVFDKGMHILLNVAVGGPWAGEPADDTPFPARMLVDHVAVYAR
ncbi:MAG: glycoside hydrolase family 16 protein [Mobilicoccus sp.]|nr:glycoside hydrolase family 16 protein [Mobilicoccus sp.]